MGQRIWRIISFEFTTLENTIWRIKQVSLYFSKHPKSNTFTSTVFEVIDILQKHPHYNHIYISDSKNMYNIWYTSVHDYIKLKKTPSWLFLYFWFWSHRHWLTFERHNRHWNRQLHSVARIKTPDFQGGPKVLSPSFSCTTSWQQAEIENYSIMR